MVCEGGVLFWGPLSTEVDRSSLVIALSFGDQRQAPLASNYILLVGKRVPHGIKGFRGDPCNNFKEMHVQNPRVIHDVVIHKDGDSQLCGRNY
ncbi:hypothetical protein TNCV_1968531 [Trichonephila clavipes]|nr:hypothetical protein TNCV_1968531 [Trichonephila clavipes]